MFRRVISIPIYVTCMNYISLIIVSHNKNSGQMTMTTPLCKKNYSSSLLKEISCDTCSTQNRSKLHGNGCSSRSLHDSSSGIKNPFQTFDRSVLLGTTAAHTVQKLLWNLFCVTDSSEDSTRLVILILEV
jgi:hypothetical protein